MLAKQRFYYRARDSVQDGVLAKKIVMSLRPVRSDRSFKPQQIFYKEHTYFGMKKKEPGKAKVVYFHQLSDNFGRISLYLTQGTVRIAKQLCSYYDNCISLVKSMHFVFFQLNLLL